MTTEKLEFEIIPALKEGEVLVVHAEVGDMNQEQIKREKVPKKGNHEKKNNLNFHELSNNECPIFQKGS